MRLAHRHLAAFLQHRCPRTRVLSNINRLVLFTSTHIFLTIDILLVCYYLSADETPCAIDRLLSLLCLYQRLARRQRWKCESRVKETLHALNTELDTISIQ